MVSPFTPVLGATIPSRSAGRGPAAGSVPAIFSSTLAAGSWCCLFLATGAGCGREGSARGRAALQALRFQAPWGGEGPVPPNRWAELRLSPWPPSAGARQKLRQPQHRSGCVRDSLQPGSCSWWLPRRVLPQLQLRSCCGHGSWQHRDRCWGARGCSAPRPSVGRSEPRSLRAGGGSLPAACQPLRMPQLGLGCDPSPSDGDGGGSLGPARAWQPRGSSQGERGGPREAPGSSPPVSFGYPNGARCRPGAS